MPDGEEFDATAAAARALGEDPSPNGSGDPSPDGTDTVDDGEADGPPDPQDADGGDTGEGPFRGLRDRLLSTEPNPPLESDELSTWDAEMGGSRRIKRGLYKMLGVDGATAVEDVLLGLVEEMSAADSSTSTSTTEDESEDLGPLAESGAVA